LIERRKAGRKIWQIVDGKLLSYIVERGEGAKLKRCHVDGQKGQYDLSEVLNGRPLGGRMWNGIAALPPYL
jgi:hypothetical protein